MTAVTKPRCLAPGDYLAEEEGAERRSEYWDGRIVAMAGASANHNRINRNLVKHLLALLDGTHCAPYWNETRIHVAECAAYFYPDALVVCGAAQMEPTETETLSNPTVLFEIISPSTEAADRGRKFACYRTLASLQHYIIIAQDMPAVDLYTRQTDGTWLLNSLTGSEAVLTLQIPALALSLADIYWDVVFPPPLRLTEGEGAE